PYFLPIGDRHIMIHYSHLSGAKYAIGDFDKKREKFVITDGGNFTFGPARPAAVHAPSATPDGKGGIIAIFDIYSGRSATLPRRLTLAEDDPLTNLYIEPAANIETLRYDHRHVDAMTLPANQDIMLDNVGGNALEIIAEIDPKGASIVELDLLCSPNKEEVTRIMFFKKRGFRYQEFGRGTVNSKKYRSVISIDTSRSSTLGNVSLRPPETAELYIAPDEPLKLRVFIDKSIVEVFVNNKQCVTAQVYPGRKDAVNVSLRAQGQDAHLNYLDAWKIKNIYE
ncbi:MAG: glycoside hydrolase family 32 protein, partial [Planctomycetes bacterium]|nr:glycoside hydrolase family 32 protein [Planctomycetota bacterium]